MHPNFRLKTASEDITEAIKRRLLSLRLTDEEGFESDELEVILDDRENLSFPGTGEQLRLWLGYGEDMVYMGEYTLQAIETRFPPRTLTLKARAVPLGQKLGKTSRHWENTCLSEIAGEIAKEAGYSLCYHASVDPKYKCIAQTEETALHFLTRLSKEAGLLFSVKNGGLLFVDKEKRPEIDIDLRDVLSAEFRFDKWSVYKGVEAWWWVPAMGKPQKITIGESPYYVLYKRFETEEEARRHAESKYRELTEKKVSLLLKIIGNAKIFAGAIFKIDGLLFKDEEKGIYAIKRVVHEISSQGFVTTIEGEWHEQS